MASEVPDVQELEQRLTRVERDNRFLILAGGAVLVVCVVALAWGIFSQRKDHTIEGRRFLLRGPEGNTRAELAVNPEGVVGLWLFDKEGKFRATVTTTATGSPGIIFYDRNGRNRAEFALLPDDSPGLALSEQGGMASVGLIVTKDSVPHFRLADKAGKFLVSVP